MGNFMFGARLSKCFPKLQPVLAHCYFYLSQNYQSQIDNSSVGWSTFYSLRDSSFCILELIIGSYSNWTVC